MSFQRQYTTTQASTLKSRMIHIGVKVILRSFIGICLFCSCQKAPTDPSLSPWGTIEWTMKQALDPANEVIEQLTPYLSEGATQSLQTFKNTLNPDQGIGLFSLTVDENQNWHGRYGYLKSGWPLTLEVHVTRVDTVWQISSFPHIEQYQAIADLLGQGRLPLVENGDPWRGGLISQDRSGRPLGEVVIAWISPYVFVDGTPLEDNPSKEVVVTALKKAFEKRRTLAWKVQAKYAAKVALALPEDATAWDAMKLVSWSEDAGAEQLSLLAQSQEGEGALFALAPRAPMVNAEVPQTLIYVDHTQNQVSLLGKRPDVKRDQTGTWTMVDDELQPDPYHKFNSKFKRKGRVHGAVINTDDTSSYSALIHLIDVMKQVDQKLPVTLAQVKDEPLKSLPRSQRMKLVDVTRGRGTRKSIEEGYGGTDDSNTDTVDPQDQTIEMTDDQPQGGLQ